MIETSTRSCQRVVGVIGTAALLSLMIAVVPRVVSAFEKQLGLGISAGYVVSSRAGGDPPEVVDGGAFGVHLTYGFNDTFGISLEGNFDLHAPYMVLLEEMVEQEDGTTAVGYVEGPTADPSFASSVAISGVYAVDVARLTPFLGLGVAGVRVDQKWTDTPRSGYLLALRVTLGADYRIIDEFALGLVMHNDSYLLGEGDFSGRFELMLRATYFFDLSNSCDGKQ